MPNWKKLIVSGSDASLNSLNVTTNVVAQSFTGSLFGTSSWARNAVTASFFSGSIQNAITASYAASASWAINSLTASYAVRFNVSQSLTASGLRYPTADNGEESFIQTDGTGNLSLQYVKTVYEEMYNGEATTIVKGTPVYISGSVGANARVFRAEAANPLKMPVVYVSADNIASGAVGRGIALGLIKGVDTTGYPAGTEIFVGPSGGWTSTRPTGSAAIQILGYITKEGAGGQGVILNPGPVNLPNIASGNVWIGNGNSAPIAISSASLFVNSASFALTSSNVLGGTTSYVPLWRGATALTSSVMYQSGSNVGIGTILPAYKLDISGDLRTTTDANFATTSGKVGIGTTSPAYKLTINTTAASENIVGIATTSNLLILGINASEGHFINSNTNLAFGAHGSEAIRITSGGNVGIGTKTPTAKLHVTGSTGGIFEVDGVNSINALYVSASGNVGINTITPTEKLTVRGNGAKIRIESESNPSSYFATMQVNWDASNPFVLNSQGFDILGSKTNIGNVSDRTTYLSSYYDLSLHAGATTTPSSSNARLYISGSGNVGIGTTSPNAKLDVNGNAIITGSLTVTGNITAQTLIVQTITSSISFITGSTRFGSLSSNTHQFTGSISATGSLVVDGNVGIGTTSLLDKLTVGTITGSSIAITNNGAVGTAASPHLMDLNFRGYGNAIKARIRAIDESSNFGGSYLSIATENASAVVTEHIRILKTGNVGIGTTSTNSKLEIKSGVTYNESLVTGAASGLLINNAGQEISIGGSGIAPYPNYIQSRQSGIAWPLILNPLGGNVGIGTTTPLYRLDVNSGTSGASFRTLSTNTTSNRVFYEATAGNVEQHFLYTGNQDWVLGLDKADSNKFKLSSADDGFASTKVTVTTAGNVGIGTSTPTSKLHVSGGSIFVDNANGSVIVRNGDATNQQQIRLRMSGNDGILDVTRNSGTQPNLIFGTEATERMRITAAGDVGLSVVPKTWQFLRGFQIGTSAAISGHLSAEASFFGSNFYYLGSSWKRITSGFSSQVEFGDGIIKFVNAGTSTADSDISYSERMRIHSNGNIGIGTSVDQTYKLDIAGTLRNTLGANFATNSGSVGIGTTSASGKLDITYSTNPTTATPHIMLTTGGVSKQAAITAEAFSVGGLIFSTGDGTLTDRMTILRTNGNVGIGNTAPSEALHVTGRIRATTIDSTSSPINLLTSNVDGVIQKTSLAAAGGIGGTGTLNYIPKWSSASTQTNSVMQESSGSIGINGAVVPDVGDTRLQINGSTYTSIFLPSTNINALLRSHNPNGLFYIGTISNHGVGILTNDAERMRITSAGNVGIGTTTPSVKLDVIGATKVASSAFGAQGGLILDYGANANSRSWKITNDINTFGDFVIQTSTTQTGSTYTDRLTINPSGNVGIGTTSANHKLDITAASIGSGYEGVNIRDAAADRIRIGYTSATTPVAGIVAAQVLAGNVESNGGLMLATRGNVQAGMSFYTSPDAGVTGLVERIRITAAGNVGIGTTSPSTALHIARTAALSPTIRLQTTDSTSNGTIQFANSSNSIIAFIGSNNNVSDGAGGLEFATGGTTTRMFISSSGNVGIGTTNPGFIINTGAFFRPEPAGKHLDILSTSNEAVLNLRSNRDTNGGQVGGIYFTRDGGQGDAHRHIGAIQVRQSSTGTLAGGSMLFFTKANSGGVLVDAARMIIDQAGNVGIGTTNPSTGKVVISQTGGTHLNLVSGDSLGSTDVLIKLTASSDFRGRGIWMENSTTSGIWYAGVPYTGGSYSIGYHTTQPEYLANSKFYISSAGNVGIGTTSPSTKLQIYTETSTQVGLSLYTANATAERTTYTASPGLELSSYQSAAGSPFTKTSDIVANADGTVPSVMRLWTKASGASTPSERMRITAAGFVGIGTTAPDSELQVGSTATNGNRTIRITDNGYGLLLSGGGGLTNNYIKSLGVTIPLYFLAGNSNDANYIFSSTGNVGIGTTTPNAKLDVNGNTIISGSFTVVTGSAVELQVTNTGVKIGSVPTDNHTVTGSLGITGSLTVNNYTSTGARPLKEVNVSGSIIASNNSTILLDTSTLNSKLLMSYGASNNFPDNYAGFSVDGNRSLRVAANNVEQFIFGWNGNFAAVGFAGIPGSPPARFYAVGAGTTSATKGLQITDSAAKDLFVVYDNGATHVTGSLNITGSLVLNGASVGLPTTVPLNRKTGSYTLALDDAGKLIEMNNGSANTVTIPPFSSVNFPSGSFIDVIQYGAGQTSFVTGSGVTIRSANGWLKINAQYGAATAIKIGGNEWYLVGNLNA